MDRTDHEKKLMGQLGTACGCIERSLMILAGNSDWHRNLMQRTLTPADYREMVEKLEKARDAVLATAQDIENAAIAEAR